MAGTDSTRASSPSGPRPAIILVGAQIGENVGAVARAMLNCGLTDLRLVRPRDGWPNPVAYKMASGADAVLDAATCHPSVEAAVADLHGLYATTARTRDMAKPILTARAAAAEMQRQSAAGERPGVLFGPERIGLTNDEVALADAVLTVPLNPHFSSLNLAQAVLLIAYEWYQAGDAIPPRQRNEEGRRRRATREEVYGFFAHLEPALDRGRFFKVPEMRSLMVRSLRNLFERAELTDQEVRTLHGVVTALSGQRKDQL